MDLTWMAELFARYERSEVEDLAATFLMTVGYTVKETPPVLLAAIEAMAARAGVEAGEKRADSEAKIRTYLADHPLNPELKLAFEQRVRTSMGEDGGEGFTEAFATLLSRDAAKRARDGKREEGTRPAYLALMAHDDVD